jgi:hypothetical protein
MLFKNQIRARDVATLEQGTRCVNGVGGGLLRFHATISVVLPKTIVGEAREARRGLPKKQGTEHFRNYQ